MSFYNPITRTTRLYNYLSADAGAGDVDMFDCRPTAFKCSIHDVLFRATLWPTWLQHKNGPIQPVKCHILTEYRHEVAAFAVAFCIVSESSSGLIPFHPFHEPYRSTLDILFPHQALARGDSSKLLKEPCIDPDSVDLSPIEPALRFKLMPFQEKGVRFGIAKSGRCMIADDMGLGKTFQALAIASYYRADWPMLIVTTSSMRLLYCRETWQNKIRELLPSVPMLSVVTVSANRDTQLAADRHTKVVIISYKMTTIHTQLLKDRKFGVIIIDESHYLKSHKAQCTAALAGVCKSAARLILLSGTPALSRPAELYTQLNIIAPNFFGGYIEYGKRYCAGKLTNFGWDMTGCSNLAELQIILQKKFLIRRTKEEVLTDLENKTRESVFLNQSLLQFSTEDLTGLSQMAARYTKTKSSERHAALLTYFSESARVKIPAICKYLKQLVREESSKDKFLVFAHHKNMIEAVCSTLDELCVHYISIVGSTPSITRAELVDKFQYSELCRCAVLSITAASAGLTLTAADLVLFAELHWNPGILIQAEARAHRIGRRGGVCVRYLLAKGTSDDFMWPMLQDKLNVLNEVGLSKDTFEDTTLKMQSEPDITCYFKESLNHKNDFIPGTNIKLSSENAAKNEISWDRDNERFSDVQNSIDKSLLEDEEGDELLLQIDL
ncbi:hypothetical protein EVAR_78621_1 [Eumeta japonica]|uniref:SWI/SNF-related matrix-associated actin-dependent regulator of chromatin subfamily A-like protein 1 n=1 Tax=Eumeta variegata TaxID=151549 RepID=A0A4C1U7T3_EUMVA|nr:hypothetical protein EVAR_78621_1 [Eumeta japonica]